MGAAAIPVAIGLQVGGGLYSAFSSKSAASARSGYLELIAERAEGNARLAELAGEKQSRAVQEAAAKNLGRFRREVKRVVGAQKAALAGKGIVGTVTAEDIARDTEAQAELDEDALRFTADSQSEEILRSAGLQAMSLRSEAGFKRLEAANVRAAGQRQFIGSLIGTATSVANTVALAYGTAGAKAPKTGRSYTGSNAYGRTGYTPKTSLLSFRGLP